MPIPEQAVERIDDVVLNNGWRNWVLVQFTGEDYEIISHMDDEADLVKFRNVLRSMLMLLDDRGRCDA